MIASDPIRVVVDDCPPLPPPSPDDPTLDEALAVLDAVNTVLDKITAGEQSAEAEAA